jgi:hypothetical protein
MPAELFQHRGVVVRVDEHGDIGMVLGGRADHGLPADIDILDARGKIRAARGRVLERIEVDDHHIDRTYPVRLQGFSVRGIAANREQPAVHRRMQGLDAAVHHLGEAGQLGNVDDCEPRACPASSRVPPVERVRCRSPQERGRTSTIPPLVGNGDGSHEARRRSSVMAVLAPALYLVMPDRRKCVSPQSRNTNSDN